MRRRIDNLPHQLTITYTLYPLAYPSFHAFTSKIVNSDPSSSILLSLLVRHGHTALLTSASLGDDGDLAFLQDPSARFQGSLRKAWLARHIPS